MFLITSGRKGLEPGFTFTIFKINSLNSDENWPTSGNEVIPLSTARLTLPFLCFCSAEFFVYSFFFSSLSLFSLSLPSLLFKNIQTHLGKSGMQSFEMP